MYNYIYKIYIICLLIQSNVDKKGSTREKTGTARGGSAHDITEVCCPPRTLFRCWGSAQGGCLGVFLSHKVLWVLPDLVLLFWVHKSGVPYYPVPTSFHHVVEPAPWNSTRKCVQRCTVHSTLLLLKKHLYYILSPVSFIREFLCVTRKYWVTHFISLMILWPINTCRGLMRSCYDC